ncbi:MAG: hypothetical protein HC892_22545 [Saprospiraceae bacterium]|nr:hypothetical protein [Saprospiraceae bacterium]
MFDTKQLKAFVTSGDTKQAIKYLLEQIPSEHTKYNQAISISSRYNTYMDARIKGLAPPDHELNSIHVAILELADQFQGHRTWGGVTMPIQQMNLLSWLVPVGVALLIGLLIGLRLMRKENTASNTPNIDATVVDTTLSIAEEDVLPKEDEIYINIKEGEEYLLLFFKQAEFKINKHLRVPISWTIDYLIDYLVFDQGLTHLLAEKHGTIHITEWDLLVNYNFDHKLDKSQRIGQTGILNKDVISLDVAFTKMKEIETATTAGLEEIEDDDKQQTKDVLVVVDTATKAERKYRLPKEQIPELKDNNLIRQVSPNLTLGDTNTWRILQKTKADQDKSRRVPN